VKNYGMAVITREGSSPSKYVYGHDTLHKFGVNEFFETLLKSQTWDRCYDFLNIFDEKFGKNFGVFCSNYC
jgi:hypothetical protein